MSGGPNILYAVSTGPIGVTSGIQTLWLLNPVTGPFIPVELGISFNASVSSVPIRADLYIAASVGSAAGNSASVYPVGSTTVAATTTAMTALGTEPSTKTLISSWFIQPFGGVLDIQYPLGREGLSSIGGATTNGRVGLQINTPTGITCNVLSYVWFEE
jgi:hypothetical protein